MKPEIAVRRLLHRLGYRYRLHERSLPGKPDIVLHQLKSIIDIRGCFWHQHRSCIDSHVPKSRRSYWERKLKRNVQRDAKNIRLLRRLGWRVLIVWECEVGAEGTEKIKKRLSRFLGQ